MVGHLEKMDIAEVSGGRVRGRQRLGCMDKSKVAMQQRDDGGGCASKRK